MKDVSDLRLLRTKRITVARQKKIKRKMNIGFLIGFLIPTINAIYQQVNVSSENQKYMIVMLIFIVLDALLYIPIFMINKNPKTKGEHKLTLLGLLQVRNLEKLMLALYLLIYFILSSNISFKSIFTDPINSFNLMLQNGMSLTLTLVSAVFTLLCGNDNRKFKKELFDANFTVSTYELDESTGDIIMKTYMNKINKKTLVFKKALFYILEAAFVILIFLFIINFL